MRLSKGFFKLTFILLLICSSSFASDTLLFVSPVEHDVKLSGNFMELRTNHFHTGIDIKSSNGRVGDPVKTVAEGYISRIKVQSGSYGQVLYIDHPNGYTSVYAHLDSFNPEVEQWVEDLQYGLESFEIDVYLPDSLFRLNAGQFIGTMGNTGRSFGPHLHFELRETKTEIPVNPELYNFGPQDKIAPVYENLVIYSINELDQITGSEIRYFKNKKPVYRLHSDLVSYGSSKIAFGVMSYDQINGSYNKNGINAYKLFMDDSLMVDWKAENYSFSESRKINGFLDYERQLRYGQKVYRLFSPKCNALNSFENSLEGIIDLGDNERHEIRIEVSDIFDNRSIIEFDITKEVSEEADDTQEQSCLQEQIFQSGMFRIEFEAESFFDDPGEMSILKTTEKIMGQTCHKLTIDKLSTPVAKYYKVSCPVPEKDIESWCYISKDKRGRWVNFGADTLENRLVSKIDQLGELYLFKDTIAPKIEVLRLDKDLKRPWLFRISDNLIPDGKTEDLYYEASVNGQWVCLEYDAKSDQLLFDDFHRLPREDFDFILKVGDAQSNLSSFEVRISDK